MQSKTSSQESKSEQITAILLASLCMFVVGYSATRIFLGQSLPGNTSSNTYVIPHQSTLWSDLGK